MLNEKKPTSNLNKRKNEIIPLILATLFFTFTLFVFAPFEMYLANLGEFWFRLSLFWFVPILVGISAALIIFAIGYLLYGKARILYTLLVFGGGLAVYLQGNLLNLNLGHLDGTAIEWHDYKGNFIINMIIWMIIILLPIVAFIIFKDKIKKIVAVVAAFLSLTQLLTLGVLFAVAKWEFAPTGEGIISTENLMQAANNHNVIVLVLDMYNNEYLENIFAKEPELEQKFDGFTMFDNFTACYPITHYALPTMLTGEWMRNEKPLNDMVGANFDKAQYWRELKANNYKYNIYSQEAHMPQWMLANVDNYVEEKRHIKSYADFTKFLYRFVAGKYLPNGIKPYVWLHGTEADALAEGEERYTFFSGNSYFKDILMHENIEVGDAENQFNFIHINGAHMPYRTDRYGNEVSEGTTVEESARGSLQLAIDYLDELNAIGKLDSATVIITADHGQGKEYERQAPLMLMKPSGAKGAMQRSSAPVWQMDLIPTIMSDIGLNNDHKYGKSCFEYKIGDKRDRMYYETDFDNITADYWFLSTLREYTIDDEDNLNSNTHKTGVFYEKSGLATKETN
ncbi:MAG: sulfatase-like hydrolase/transferase [Oscillospiraceae bacterium]